MADKRNFNFNNNKKGFREYLQHKSSKPYSRNVPSQDLNSGIKRRHVSETDDVKTKKFKNEEPNYETVPTSSKTTVPFYTTTSSVTPAQKTNLAENRLKKLRQELMQKQKEERSNAFLTTRGVTTDNKVNFEYKYSEKNKTVSNEKRNFKSKDQDKSEIRKKSSYDRLSLPGSSKIDSINTSLSSARQHSTHKSIRSRLSLGNRPKFRDDEIKVNPTISNLCKDNSQNYVRNTFKENNSTVTSTEFKEKPVLFTIGSSTPNKTPVNKALHSQLDSIIPVNNAFSQAGTSLNSSDSFSFINQTVADKKTSNTGFSFMKQFEKTSTVIKNDPEPDPDVNVESSPKSTQSSEMTMDWCPVDDAIIVENVSEIRKEINYTAHLAAVPVEEDKNIKKIKGVFVVVDTNIFLSHLTFISELKNMTFTDLGPTIIFVPWMVTQELDYMKDGRSSESLEHGSRRAVRYINKCLESKDPRFKGQTVIEASQHELTSNNPDDGILFCCLQLEKQGKTVVLLSNDLQLRNKTLLSGIMAFSRDDIVSGLKNKYNGASEQKSITKINMVMSNVLTLIIETDMKKAYGEIWQRMASIVPPVTVTEGLNCLKKYWVAVFSFSLLKQCLQCVDEFIVFNTKLGNREAVDEKEYEKFIEFCLRLCIYFKNGYPRFKDEISRGIQSIQGCA